MSLSSVAVQQALGISDSSYRRAVEDLLVAGYLIMRNDNERTLDFYTSPQPTTYVKTERKKKPAIGDGAASTEPVSIDEAPCEPPAYEEPPHVIYHSSSGYGWEET